MMETKIEVPSQVRELVAISVDNIEMALALFFDAATNRLHRVRLNQSRCSNGLSP
jgi:hypothetical protein